MTSFVSQSTWTFTDPVGTLLDEIEIGVNSLRQDESWIIPAYYVTRNDTEKLVYAINHFLAKGPRTRTRLTEVLRIRAGSDVTSVAISASEMALKNMCLLED